jgi:hypothetical protein
LSDLKFVGVDLLNLSITYTYWRGCHFEYSLFSYLQMLNSIPKKVQLLPSAVLANMMLSGRYFSSDNVSTSENKVKVPPKCPKPWTSDKVKFTKVLRKCSQKNCPRSCKLILKKLPEKLQTVHEAKPTKELLKMSNQLTMKQQN